jgi:hypothetical protein
MPRIAENGPTSSLGRPAKYPYDEWVELAIANPGSWIELVQGEDFDEPPHNVKVTLFNYTGLRVKGFVEVREGGSSVWIRLMPFPEPETFVSVKVSVPD